MARYRKYIVWTVAALAAIWLLRVFVFQTFRVDNHYMGSTLLPGDRVWVDRTTGGSRIPLSPIGIPGSKSLYADWFRLPPVRLPAIRKIRRQDVLLYNSPIGSDKPIDRKNLFINRVIGLPNDTVLIMNQVVIVNHDTIPVPAGSRSEYRIVTDGRQIPVEFLRKFTVDKPRLVADVGIYDADLTVTAAEELRKTEGIRTVRATMQFLGDPAIEYYPESAFIVWNRDQFGNLVVPSKGMEVKIDIRTIDFYRDMIETHEKHDVSIDFSGVYIDGKKVDSYTFEKDYLFLLSDNRGHPNDSRISGLVPVDHVAGRVTRVLGSPAGKAFRKVR